MADIPALSLYDAVSEAETGSFSNPWIRTTARNTPGGSSAYGPVQITGRKAYDYAKRWLLSPEMTEYVMTRYGPMTDKFLEYGNEPKKKGYDKKWDYGGTGDFTDVDKANYLKLADEMLAYDYINNSTDLNAFIKAWRGTGSDERYNNIINRRMEQLRSK